MLSNAGRSDDFFIVYDTFVASKLRPDTATVVALIKACAAKGETARAHTYLLEAEEQKLKLKLRCFSEVLRAHCKVGELEMAEEVRAETIATNLRTLAEFRVAAHCAVLC